MVENKCQILKRVSGTKLGDKGYLYKKKEKVMMKDAMKKAKYRTCVGGKITFKSMGVAGLKFYRVRSPMAFTDFIGWKRKSAASLQVVGMDDACLSSFCKYII